MNWKVTVALVVVALAVAIVVYINPFAEEVELRAGSPWFYQVSMDDVISINVKSFDDRVEFHKVGPGKWVFDDPEGVPTDSFRWGGIVLLVSGPRTSRDFSTVRQTIDDPAEYGLDEPGLVVDVGLTAGRELQFRLGDTTTDGDSHYGQVSGFSELFLIADAWGDVLTRLAKEPPIPPWYVKRDTADIREFNVTFGDPAEEETPRLRLKQQDGAWIARNFLEDDADRPLDADKWSAMTHLVAGPPDIEVEEPFVDDRDYTPWGVSDDSPTILVRFADVSSQGTVFIDGIRFIIGDKTPDGDQHYVIPRPMSQDPRSPVLRVDIEWADTVLGLFDTVPYAETDALAESATSTPG